MGATARGKRAGTKKYEKRAARLAATLKGPARARSARAYARERKAGGFVTRKGGGRAR